MNEYWFRPHRFGLGASPKTWEGWALLGAYAAALLILALATDSPLQAGADKPLGFVVAALALTAVFLCICWRKTEGGWRWRWGED